MKKLVFLISNCRFTYFGPFWPKVKVFQKCSTGIIVRLSNFTSSLPIETIVGASAGGGFLLILSIVLTVVCCRKRFNLKDFRSCCFIGFRAEPAREESAVEVWESAKPDSPYYDQGDYDEMDHNKTGEPKKNREERKEEATDYEMDRAGTYLEL